MFLQYRAAAVAGMGTQLFFGLVLTMVYEAFYRSSSAPQPMSYRQVVTYVWLGQAFLAMLPWYTDYEMYGMIRSGAVAYELLRPVDLYALWYCRVLASRVASTLLRAGPILVVAGLFLGMEPPASPASAAAWALAMFGALLLGCSISVLSMTTLLWTTSGLGISQLMPTFVVVLSGMSVPLPLFPAWARPILDVLPFRGLVDTPFRLYAGHLLPAQVMPLFLQQLGWTAAFVLLGRWLLARGMRHLVIQGG
jgi:ABC-2 type transport system permease protein